MHEGHPTDGPTAGHHCATLSGAPAAYPGGVVDLGDGVRAWLQPNGSWGEANSLLVSDGGASLLVDTLWDAELARQMLTALAEPLASHPIRTVLNTHRDGDHWWGNVAVPSDARILATDAALEEMRTEPPPSAMGRLARLSRLGSRLPGQLGRVSAYSAGMLGPFSHTGLRTRLPDESFSGRRTLPVGAREVSAIEVGPAHTAGDAVVHVPHNGVVACGDLLFADVTPVIWHGPMQNWVSALDLVLGLDADRFVPGHGRMAGREDVQALRDYWTWLIEAGGSEHRAGRKPLAAARTLVRSRDFDRWRRWRLPERIVLNTVALFRELDGLPPLPTTAANRARLFRSVALLAGELEHTG